MLGHSLLVRSLKLMAVSFMPATTYIPNRFQTLQPKPYSKAILFPKMPNPKLNPKPYANHPKPLSEAILFPLNPKPQTLIRGHTLPTDAHPNCRGRLGGCEAGPQGLATGLIWGL